MNGEIRFEKDDYGFWHQMNPEKFQYTEDYKKIQKTTVEMSWLRLGFLFSVISPTIAKKFVACDVGSGNGCFAKEASRFFEKGIRQYDLSGESISREELIKTHWDIIFLTDVLEHFESIDDLFDISFDYGFFSFPETPKVDDWKQLVNWRHFRPNEHIWCLYADGMKQWVEAHGYEVISVGNPSAVQLPF